MVKKDNEKDISKNKNDTTDKEDDKEKKDTDKDMKKDTDKDSSSPKAKTDLDIDLDSLEMDTDKTTTPSKKKKPRKHRKRFIVRNDPSGNNSVTKDNDTTKHAKRKLEESRLTDNPSEKSDKIADKKSPSSKREGSDVKRPKMTGPNIIRIPTELLPDNAISGGIIMSIEGSSNLSDFLSSLQNSNTSQSDSGDKDKSGKGKTGKTGKTSKPKADTPPDDNLDSEGFLVTDTDEDNTDKYKDSMEQVDEEDHKKVTVETVEESLEETDLDLDEKEEAEEEAEEEEEEEELPYFKIKGYKAIDNLPQRLYPIDSLQKVISLGHLYRHPNFRFKNYSVNVKGLYQMIPALQKLNSLVGLEKIKKKVIDQIMFFSQDLHNQEWYYYQQQKLLEQESQKQEGFHHPLHPPPRGHRNNGPRHPLEALLQIIPLQGPPPHSRNQKEDEMYWAGGGGSGDGNGGGGRSGDRRGGRGGRGRSSGRGSGGRGSGGRGGRGGRKKDGRGGRRGGTPSHRDHNHQSVPVDTPQKGLDPHLSDESSDMLHTVIAGPPGVGKTVFGKILADIYLSLGITSRNSFKIVRRSDLVGEYLGQTAIKTQKAIDSALGGVLFIDEAYSLGCNDGRRKSDSFSKECIDTLNQNLSEKKGQFICIIAGYPEELEKHFFSVNPGLQRRFSFHYHIEGYDWKELTEILCRKIASIGWKLDGVAREWLFQEKGFMEGHVKDFPNFGGDIETLLLNIKIVHGRRVFGMHPREHKLIREIDIRDGYQRYQSSNRGSEETDPAPTTMYM